MSSTEVRPTYLLLHTSIAAWIWLVACSALAQEYGNPNAPGPTPPPDATQTVPAAANAELSSAPADAPATQPAPAAPTSPEAAAAGVVPDDVQEPPLDVPTELQSLRDDHQGLVTDIENFKFQWQRERDLHTALTTRGLLIGGTIQARASYISQDQGGPKGTAVSLPVGSSWKRRSSFDISTAVLNFTGLLYKDYEEGRNLTYNLRFGASPQTAPVVNSNFVNLLDANIVYSVLPTVDRETAQLTITFGQQLLPFGLEAAATEELKPVIRNALFTNASYTPGAKAAAGGLGLNREIGLIVRGDLFPQVDYGYNYRQALITYAIGIVNGNGVNTPDDNNAKDIVGRLAFTVPAEYNSWLRQITVGGTAYIGKRNVYLTDDARTNLGTGKKQRYGIDVYYNHWPFGVTYEYVVAKDTVAFGSSKDNQLQRDIVSRAHTGTLFLSFGEQFVAGFRNQGRFDDWWPKTYQPFVRYDRFERDVDAPGKDRVEVVTAGLNIFFAETTKFQLNYSWRRDARVLRDQMLDESLRHPSHEFFCQFQYGF